MLVTLLFVKINENINFYRDLDMIQTWFYRDSSVTGFSFE